MTTSRATHTGTAAAPSPRRQVATLRYLHIAPRKVRAVAETLKGLPAREAEAQLLLRPERAARPLLKLLRSAVANASRGNRAKPQELLVSSVRVDKGPMLKRYLPRAQGRATPIHKIMSHVTVVLEAAPGAPPERFVITPPPKKEKKKGNPAAAKPKPPELKEEKKQETVKKEPGFFRRIFRRKSV